MKKEELIEELKKEIEATKNVLNCEERFSLYAKGKRVGLEFGWMFAEKLDEPEITEEQAWRVIAETHNQDESYWLDAKNRYINSISESELPEVPVIPQFVNKWLKKRKKDFKTAHDAILYIHSCGWDDETHIEFKLYKWIPDNLELFIRAWNDICTIEKEPQWVVKDDTGYLSYLQFSIPNVYECETSLGRNDAFKFNSKEKAEAVALLINGTVIEVTELSFIDLVKEYFPNVSDKEADSILWDKTCFPIRTDEKEIERDLIEYKEELNNE